MALSEIASFKLRILVVYFLIYGVFYILPNFRPMSQPDMMPMFPIDQGIPFLPWTFLIYTSDYFLLLLVILLHPTIETFRSFMRQSILVLVICGTFFLLCPTTYPRPDYPPVSNPLIALVMWVVRSADTPNNCFPSMHVALTGIATLSLRTIQPRLFPVFALWSTLIFLSTLTTKQHYLVDVVGGINVIAFVAIFHWLVLRHLDAIWAERQAALH
ncbi:MAG: phosphatase PAP2 family protein [Deltaproteobacteria bacterium]|nr:phosphatase PAP2 family protein [Deltaproteobacteria bacterium]MBI3293137.1 phosphatase PAP2 family protein [Deltaproteobacteria bacterium]